MTREEGLETTIRRLAGFPLSLPSSVLNALDKLSDIDVENFIRGLLRADGSPVSRMHLVRILTHFGYRRKSYHRLARKMIAGLY